ncbi:protein RRP6-like 2 [Folsomia candida]|uniref:protein RRP6-like 2 n=1 Tax=Folsomia candida TaxID=158441 RepID=UPI001604E1F7|nr:protein RRP6-like 2 [Folsomia candida]
MSKGQRQRANRKLRTLASANNPPQSQLTDVIFETFNAHQSQHQPAESSNEKKLTFWEKKRKAFEKYGEADVGPQESYRYFLLHRRQLNNGSKDDMWASNSKAAQIRESKFPENLLGNFPEPVYPPLYLNDMKIVNDDTSFQSMMTHLCMQTQISIDLEGNDDHSFLGMTVIIQIGTKDVDYIIDVFPVVELIKSSLKDYLEDTSAVKYLFGGDNDIIWLKRDFFINIVNVLDVQILFQLVLQNSLFDTVTRSVPFENRKRWYHNYIGSRSKFTTADEQHQWEKAAGSQPMTFEKLCNLFYPEVDIDKDAQVADFRPRSDHDVGYKKLLRYARDDVHILLRIVIIIKSHLGGAMESSMLNTAFDATKSKLNSKYAKRVDQTGLQYLSRKEAISISGAHRDLFATVYDWRNHHASLIDEAPRSMFTEIMIKGLLENPPASAQEIDARVSVSRGRLGKRVPESIETWRDTLFKIIVQGQAYYDKIMQIKCHNCREVKGHAAWGCPDPWSTQSTKENLREDDEARRRQNHRRQINKRRNASAKTAKNNKLCHYHILFGLHYNISIYVLIIINVLIIIITHK